MKFVIGFAIGLALGASVAGAVAYCHGLNVKHKEWCDAFHLDEQSDITAVADFAELHKSHAAVANDMLAEMHNERCDKFKVDGKYEYESSTSPAGYMVKWPDGTIEPGVFNSAYECIDRGNYLWAKRQGWPRKTIREIENEWNINHGKSKSESS